MAAVTGADSPLRTQSRLLSMETSMLLVIDLQEKFIPVIPGYGQFLSRAEILIKSAKLLGIPIIVSEQYPKGLGETIAALKTHLPEDFVCHHKTTFGCLATPALESAVAALNRPQVMVCGFETHVCVSQTVHQLLEKGFQVHLIEDAVCSRSEGNREIALRKMAQSGAIPSCVEMALFELLRDAAHPHFKTLLPFIK